MAIEPSTGSAPKLFRKLNSRDRRTDQWGMSSMIIAADAISRNRASVIRRDSRPRGCAGAVAVKHSARASREMPRKRKSRQTRVRDLLNARTCSSRSDLVAASPLAQEISATGIYLDSARLESTSIRRPFLSLQRSAEKRRDGYARKPSSLLLCRGHDAHTRCSPHKSPNRRQPDRSKGVPDAANTPA